MFKRVDEIISTLKNIERMLRYIVSYLAKQEQTKSTTIRKVKND